MRYKKILITSFVILFLITTVFVALYLIVNQREKASSAIYDNNNDNSLEGNINNEPAVLSEEELQSLIESTIPTENAEPVLSDNEMESLIEATIPSENEESVLSEEELQKLIESTIPKN